MSNKTTTKTDPYEAMTDFLGFLRYVHYTHTGTKTDKYNMLLTTLAHDINGIVNNDYTFTPRTYGYAKYLQP